MQRTNIIHINAQSTETSDSEIINDFDSLSCEERDEKRSKASLVTDSKLVCLPTFSG